MEALLPALVIKLKKRGVTKSMLHAQYIGSSPDGYKFSRFLEVLNTYMGVAKPSMRMIHKAGDKLFIDFTGEKLHTVDKATGEVQNAEVFVAVLGCIQLTFVMAAASQKEEDFIHALEQAFIFYGGVPQAVVPDNLKSAVTKASRYEAELNEGFAIFAAHYITPMFFLPGLISPKTKRWRNVP